MRRLTLVALLLGLVAASAIASRTVGAQIRPVEAAPQNAVYLELLGSGGVFSLNYERLVRERVALRVGAGTWEGDDMFGAGTTSVTTVPVTVSILRGADRHHLEAGGGILLGRKSFESSFGEPAESTSVFALSGIIGYRYQQPGGGFLFRSTFTPLLGFGSDEDAYPDKGIFPSVGVSFGWGF